MVGEEKKIYVCYECGGTNIGSAGGVDVEIIWSWNLEKQEWEYRYEPDTPPAPDESDLECECGSWTINQVALDSQPLGGERVIMLSDDDLDETLDYWYMHSDTNTLHHGDDIYQIKHDRSRSNGSKSTKTIEAPNANEPIILRKIGVHQWEIVE